MADRAMPSTVRGNGFTPRFGSWEEVRIEMTKLAATFADIGIAWRRVLKTN